MNFQRDSPFPWPFLLIIPDKYVVKANTVIGREQKNKIALELFSVSYPFRDEFVLSLFKKQRSKTPHKKGFDLLNASEALVHDKVGSMNVLFIQGKDMFESVGTNFD